MDLVVTGRGTTVCPALQQWAKDRLPRLLRVDPSGERLELELCVERNPRQREGHMQVQLTWSGSNVRHATGCGPTAYAALSVALDRLCRQLREASAKSRVHHGQHQCSSVRTLPLAVDEQMEADSRYLAQAWYGAPSVA